MTYENIRGRANVRQRLAVAALVAVAGIGAALGCGGGNEGGVAASKLPEGTKSVSIDHEDCTEGGHKVELIDVTNDGKPDIKKISDV